MGYANAVLLVLFVTGFALFAYGTTSSGQAAEARVDFESIEGDVPAGSDVVAYGDLSDSLRRAFDRAERTGSAVTVAMAKSGIDVDYVEYDGQYYRVTVDTRDGDDAALELPLGLVGAVLSALSTVVYLLIRRETAG